ncbi:ionotropic receptor 21a-like [Panulirus ornatus]|uniref:ionotropic receptor 21a-like n=1 Tax=Panulirus ornatus TaxID=150431 RepID=UPI003A8A95DB
MPGGSSSRLLMGTWLVFAFIIGTVYRGNLTAALTLPKYPPRPETVEELVNYVDRVTIPPYGEEWQKQFRESGSSALESLAELMHIGPTILQGLQEALTKKQAHLCARQDFEYWVAGRLTRSDGSNPLYFGRENLIPGASAWPVPHDAPYKPQLDTVMMIVKEAGLYEKWTEDTLDETRLENRAKDREQRQEKGWVETHAATSLSKALTIVHMQGPLILLLLGFIISGLAFTIELLKLPLCP